MPKPDPGPDFWSLIEPHTGPIHSVRHTTRGYTSDVTAIVHAEAGPMFVKAGRYPGPHASSLHREAAINPYVRSVSPTLRWRQRGGGWIALGFDVAAGTHADFTPGSTDLPAVVDAIAAIGILTCPDIAREWIEVRWDRFTDRPELFAGDALLYTDINPDNMLVSGSGVSVVDWSWPTRGAAFIDPACLVVQLVAAGHSPADAESWASRCPAWSAADPVVVDAFAAATVRMYQHFEKRDPAAWRTAMTSAVTSWAEHRRSLCWRRSDRGN
jgi:hypothetical protein